MAKKKSTKNRSSGSSKKGVYHAKARITAHVKVKPNGQPRRKGWG
jgi:hypothetical protein